MNQQELFKMPEADKPKLDPSLLLHPNIPKPLHGISPRAIKGNRWWDRVRQDAYAARDYTCWACGVHKREAKYHQWLEGHEIYEYDYENGCVTFVRLCALCHACHNYIHDGRMQMLVLQGKMLQAKMDFILDHGERVLREAGYRHFRPDVPDVPEVPWGQWHMVIDGTKYYSCFSGMEEWADYYVVRHGKGKLTPRLTPFSASDTPNAATAPVVRPVASRHAAFTDFGPLSPRRGSRDGSWDGLSRHLDRIAAKHGHDFDPDIF